MDRGRAEESPSARAQRREALARAQDQLSGASDALAAMNSDKLTVDEWQSALAAHGWTLDAAQDAATSVSSTFGLRSGSARLLHYLRTHVGEVVHGTELAAVAGIGEWARRLRELRTEDGWPIESGTTRSDMSSNAYVLVRDERDVDLANAWKTARDVRKQPGAGKDRAFAYLRAIFPMAADQDQMAYVSRIQSWTRRVRELEEEGWQVLSNVDDPSLAPGSYRLGSLEQGPARPREAIKMRHRILDRDDRTCQDCGAQPSRDRVRLQVHHVVPVNQGGKNEDGNLITLCEADHAGRHALSGKGRTFDEVLDARDEPPLREQ